MLKKAKKSVFRVALRWCVICSGTFLGASATILTLGYADPAVRESMLDQYARWRLYRQTDGLPGCNGGTLYLIDKQGEIRPGGLSFGLPAFTKRIPVRREIELSKAQAKSIAHAWRRLKFGMEYGWQGHDPEYGLVLTSWGRPVLITSIDMDWNTFYFDTGAGAMEISGFDSNGLEGQHLRRELQAVMEQQKKPEH